MHVELQLPYNTTEVPQLFLAPPQDILPSGVLPYHWNQGSPFLIRFASLPQIPSGAVGHAADLPSCGQPLRPEAALRFPP